MARFVQLLEGSSPSTARAIVVVADPRVVAECAALIARRFAQDEAVGDVSTGCLRALPTPPPDSEVEP
jgi:hypothetical protein